MSENGRLTRKQIKTIGALLACQTIAESASMAGVLLQATKEARKKGDIGACEWLQSDGVEYAAIIGLDTRAVKSKAAEWARSPGGAIVIKLVEG